MEIREARPSDYNTMIQYGYKFFQLTKYKNVPYDPLSVRQMLETTSENGINIVVEDNGVIVGMAGAVIAPAYFNNNYLVGAELFWWVEPEYRDAGVGKLIVDELERRGKEAGVTFWSMMILESVEPEKATAMYKKLGYEPAERTFLKIL